MRSTRLLKLNPKTAIKISNRIVERKFIIAKILFLGKANTKIARDFEPPFGRARSARKPPKSMGGAVRRPRNGWSKVRKSNLGVYLRFRSNLLYQKLLNKTRPRKPVPPPLAPLATPQKNTLYSFHFARPRFFLLLMKRVFFCGVLPSKYSGKWRDWPHFDFAREKRNSPPKTPFRFSLAQTERERKQAGKNSFPPTPFLFARLLALGGGFARIFCGRAIVFLIALVYSFFMLSY